MYLLFVPDEIRCQEYTRKIYIRALCFRLILSHIYIAHYIMFLSYDNFNNRAHDKNHKSNQSNTFILFLKSISSINRKVNLFVYAKLQSNFIFGFFSFKAIVENVVRNSKIKSTWNKNMFTNMWIIHYILAKAVDNIIIVILTERPNNILINW